MNASGSVAVSMKLLLPLLAAVMALSPLAIDLYLPAMPTIAQYLSTEVKLVQNTLSIYLLGYALGLILFGPMADKYPRRNLAIIGLSGFFVCTFTLPFTQTIEQFMALRLVQAFISSAATVLVPGVIREYYKENSAKGLSYVSMIMMLAPMIAPLIGSFILLHSWQMIFWSLAGYCAVLLLLVIKFLPEKNNHVSANSFTFIQRYKIVFGQQKARFDLMTSMAVSLAFFAYITAVPFVYLEAFQLSEFMFSLLFGLNVLGLMSAHFINTRLVERRGSQTMLNSGLIVALICSAVIMIANAYSASSLITIVFILPLMGSFSMIAVNSDALILNRFPEQSGTATAVIGTLRFGIGALAGPILTFFHDDTARPFSALMFVSVVIVVLSQWLKQRKTEQKG